MLAELAIANAAFAVIKKTLANGKELLDAGDAVNDYFKAEKDIARQVESGTGNALEAFQAKEQLIKQEDELKFMLNKQRMLGYHDFLEFKAKYSRDLREADKVEAKRKYAREAAIHENVMAGAKAFGILLVIVSAAFGVVLYIK